MANVKFEVTSSHKATVTINNPNPVPVGIYTCTLELVHPTFGVIGGSDFGPTDVPANGQVSLSATVVMPATAATYDVKIRIDWAKGVLSFAAGSVDLYELQAPTATLGW